jgi:hypothetical protein
MLDDERLEEVEGEKGVCWRRKGRGRKESVLEEEKAEGEKGERHAGEEGGGGWKEREETSGPKSMRELVRGANMNHVQN